MWRMPSFQTVECEAGDLVRVASIAMEVTPGLFRVAKKGRNTVYLVPFSNPEQEPKAMHKTRVIEVVSVVDDAKAAAIDIAPTPDIPVQEQPVVIKRKRGRPPKPKPPENVFSMNAYLGTFGQGVELWVRPGRSTSSNILIESDRKSFWYFRTDPGNERPKRKFYGPIPTRLGRHFDLPDYGVKIAVLTAKGYIKR